ncbi:MAG TPA: serine/threonine-protein kinase, partial [Polyangiaceae bacterium]
GRQAQRFLREARAASRIRSPHVARVFDVDLRADGAPFIVMEHLAGETLAARLRREGPLPIHHTVDHLLEACEAIAEAHSLGIIHRDLKPANLFLARGAGNIELLKVLDFGISKLVAPDSSDADSTTGEGFVGSPPYMSPEQLTDPTRIDHRTDIWSLGVILYELVSGEAPFKAETLPQVCALILTGPIPPVRRRAPHVSEAFEALILRCMTREPNGRFANVAELAAALSQFVPPRAQHFTSRISAVLGTSTNPGLGVSGSSGTPAGQGATSAAWGETAPGLPPRRRPLALIAGAVVLLGLLVGGGAIYALAGRPSGGDAPLASATQALPPLTNEPATAGRSTLPDVTRASPPAPSVSPPVVASAPPLTATAKATPAVTARAASKTPGKGASAGAPPPGPAKPPSVPTTKATVQDLGGRL